MSNGVPASPSSQSGRPSQLGSLHAENSSASVGMAAAGPHHATQPHASHKHDPQADQGLGALYRQAEGRQQADQSASEQAGAGVHVGSWTQQEASHQSSSPTAATSSAQAGAGDTPKTLQLKALAAQAERLRQVGLAGLKVHDIQVAIASNTHRLLPVPCCLWLPSDPGTFLMHHACLLFKLSLDT